MTKEKDSTTLQAARQTRQRHRGSLTRDDVVDAALEIVGAHGVDALTMNGLARQLGVGAMTVYGYIDSKDELFTLMAERVMDDLPLPDVSGEWSSELARTMRERRAHMLKYPGAAALLTGRRSWSDRTAAYMESVLECLVNGGWTLDDAVAVFHLAQNYVIGFVTYEVPRRITLSYEEHQLRWYVTLAHYPEKDYPLIHSAKDEVPKGALAEQFEFGVTTLVAGLRTIHDAPERSRDRPPLSPAG